MKWAFWRRAREGDAVEPPARRGNAGGERGPAREPADGIDAATALRARARRRLIGAAALLLAAVVIVPMVLDPAPRPVADSIAIDIPSERSPFRPRLALPPDPAAEPGGGAAADAQSEAAARVDRDARATMQERSAGRTAPGPAEDAAERARRAERERPPAGGAARSDDGQRAREILEGGAARSSPYVLQVAAFASEKSATELAARLKKDGHRAFTERIQAADGPRWRVRVGPFPSRAEADAERARLRQHGVTASLVLPER